MAGISESRQEGWPPGREGMSIQRSARARPGGSMTFILSVMRSDWSFTQGNGMI